MNFALFFLFVVYAIVLLRAAWVNEDAYITMRTVDNFIHGYGLRWNVAERVQTFTHPLWLFLISIFYFFTNEAFYTLMFVSYITSLAVFFAIAVHIKKPKLASLAALTILIFSKAYVDFASSGFENPATHLLLAVFLALFLENADDNFSNGRSIFFMGLLASLAATNRMDTVLFFVPSLLLIFIKRPKLDALKYVLLGFLPFIIWEIFSIVYYGFPFPNTAYAKLYTGVPRRDLIEHGVLYVLNSLNWDPLTLLTISAGVGLALIQGTWKERSVAIGVLLYVSYVVWIGADYMSGRFFSAALVVSVILLIRQFRNARLTEGYIILVLIFAIAFASPTPTLMNAVEGYSTSPGRVDVNKIVDWRTSSFQTSGLLAAQKGVAQPHHPWALEGLHFKQINRKFVIYSNVGYVGYFAGPQVYIIDPYALTDSFLARLKPIKKPDWFVGHFDRAIPNGYLDTLKKGTNLFENRGLGEFYEKMTLIVRGPIFSWERFVAIWKMNTGQYDYLLKEYEKSQDKNASLSE